VIRFYSFSSQDKSSQHSPQNWVLVLGHLEGLPPTAPFAVLLDHERFDSGYPSVRRADGKSALGVLLEVSDSDLARCDAFVGNKVGPCFHRFKTAVRTALDGFEIKDVWVYQAIAHADADHIATSNFGVSVDEINSAMEEISK
jgi:hypothetical protein